MGLTPGVPAPEESSRLLGDPVGLRAALDRSGYLLLRGLLPAGELGELAGELAGVLVGAGWAEPVGHPGGPLLPTERARREAGDPVAARVVGRALYCVEAAHRLPHHPRLLELFGTLLGPGPLLVHPHPACRAVLPEGPEGSRATPAHQDHLGMQGTRETFTAFLALRPCPLEAGPLALAAGSQLGGSRPYRSSPGSRVFGCDESGLEGTWVAGGLEPGDVLLFHSLTVHRALPNRSGEIRLSLDARYQGAGDPVSEISIRERADLPWETLYAGWSRTDLRRYWEELPLEVVPFDPTAHLGGRG